MQKTCRTPDGQKRRSPSCIGEPAFHPNTSSDVKQEDGYDDNATIAASKSAITSASASSLTYAGPTPSTSRRRSGLQKRRQNENFLVDYLSLQERHLQLLAKNPLVISRLKCVCSASNGVPLGCHESTCDATLKTSLGHKMHH